MLGLAHLIQGGCYDWPQPDYLLTKLFFPWIGNERETSSEIKEIEHVFHKITHCLTLKSAFEAKFIISLFERAFKMTKNGVYFILIALLVAALFKILIYAN